MWEPTGKCQVAEDVGIPSTQLFPGSQELDTQGGHKLEVPEKRIELQSISIPGCSSQGKLRHEPPRLHTDGIDGERNGGSSFIRSTLEVPDVRRHHGPGGGNAVFHNRDPTCDGNAFAAAAEKGTGLEISGKLKGELPDNAFPRDSGLDHLHSTCMAHSPNSNILSMTTTSNRSNGTVSSQSTEKTSSPSTLLTNSQKNPPNALTSRRQVHSSKNLSNSDNSKSHKEFSKVSHPYHTQDDLHHATSLRPHRQRENEDEKEAQATRERCSQIASLPPTLVTPTGLDSVEQRRLIEDRAFLTSTHSGSRDSPCLHHPIAKAEGKQEADFVGSKKDEMNDSYLPKGKQNEEDWASHTSLPNQEQKEIGKTGSPRYSAENSSPVLTKSIGEEKHKGQPLELPPSSSATASPSSIPLNGDSRTTAGASKVSVGEEFASKVTHLSPLEALTCYIGPLYAHLRQRKAQRERQRLRDLENTGDTRESFNDGFDDSNGYYIVIVGETIRERYVVLDLLGFGSYGRVVRCYDEKWGMNVALKITRAGKAYQKQAMIEVNILRAVSRLPNAKRRAVRFVKVFDWKGHLVLVFELLSHNLYQVLRQSGFSGLSLSFVRDASYQLLEILGEMSRHRPHGIIHCDLKPENVLLRCEGNPHIALIDFGSACYANQCMRTYVQSGYYRSPEVIFHLPYGVAIDRWSLGCMMVEFYTGTPLFDGRDERELIGLFESTLGPVPQDMLQQSIHARKFYKYTNNQYQLVEPSSRNRTLQSILNARLERTKPSTDNDGDLNQNESSSKTSTMPRMELEEDREPRFEDFCDLVTRLLVYRPNDRISCEDALRHRFFEASPFLSSHSVPESQVRVQVGIKKEEENFNK